ncbi:hypothetical protein [Mesorhizobium amorphae]|nr:hypothetical protein [Mesorhizobium amorphae]
MAPVPKRLSIVSYAGPYPRVRISKLEFERLQEIYGVTLRTLDRRKVRAIANRFLKGKVWELVSEPRSKTRAKFEEVRQAVAPFVRFAEGGLLGNGDAANALESLLADSYESIFISIQREHVRVMPSEGHLEPSNSPVFVNLNASVLMNFAHGLVLSMDRVGSAIKQDQEVGFAPGSAFRDFLWQLRDWAKSAGHPISPFKQATIDDAIDAPEKMASPFSEFIYALNLCFRSVKAPIAIQSADDPEKLSLQEKVESPTALAERLKAVAAEANSWAAQGG